jgi:hypothetical protein
MFTSVNTVYTKHFQAGETSESGQLVMPRATKITLAKAQNGTLYTLVYIVYTNVYKCKHSVYKAFYELVEFPKCGLLPVKIVLIAI